jgi:hypothetical protein
MNPQKAEKLFALMKQYGVELFKNEKIEIKMGSNTSIVSNFIKSENESKLPEPQAIPPVDIKIPHHINEVSNLLKLNDNDLVDKLFPDYSQQNEGA